MAWENINEMFPEGGIYIDDKYLTNDEIRNSETQVVSYIKTKPVRTMTQEILRYSYYANGDFTITKEYDIFP